MGVRYFGFLVGYEFGVFFEDIVDVSNGIIDFVLDIKEVIYGVDKDVRIFVFVILICLYCLFVVRMVYKFVIENIFVGKGKIFGDMVEVIEYFEWVD